MVGWSQQTRGAWHGWLQRFREASKGQQLPEPELSKFKPRFPDIPKREDYKEPAGEKFWEQFPANNVLKAVPGISSVALKGMVDRLGTSDRDRVDRVISYIENGADIGCRGIYTIQVSYGKQ